MTKTRFAGVGSRAFVLILALAALWPMRARAQANKPSYPEMAPLDQYLMTDRTAEIALARSAAPPSIARDAEVLVVGRHGYETAVKGTNGFVCVVERSWGADFDDPEFWNPKIRAPLCFNPPAARSILPARAKRQEMIMAGVPKTQVFDRIKAAFDKKQLPAAEVGAMCFMMSKDAYLTDRGSHDLSHVMFEVARTDLGADIESDDAPEPWHEFIAPVEKWSDGAPAANEPVN